MESKGKGSGLGKIRRPVCKIVIGNTTSGADVFARVMEWDLENAKDPNTLDRRIVGAQQEAANNYFYGVHRTE